METRNRMCNSCKVEKTLDLFSYEALGPLGRSRYCLECNRARIRAYRAKHPEKHREQEKRRRARRAPQIAAQKAKWYEENREHALARNLENTRKRRREQPDRTHDIYLKSAYGVPYGTYNRLLAEQNGGCAICGTQIPGHGRKRFPLDHDHATGVIRGLLCGNCNSGIGYLQHSIPSLLAAIQYLLKYNQLSKSSSIGAGGLDSSTE